MSCDTSSPKAKGNAHSSHILPSPIHRKSPARNPALTTQTTGPMPHPENPFALTYVVSLLHALPLLFRVERPPTVEKGGVIQPLSLLELTEISREYLAMHPHGRIPIPMPLNPVYVHQHRSTMYAALHTLPIDSRYIDMASTLISATYPFHFGWNHHEPFPISHITPIRPTPVLRSTSLTETYHYSQFNDGVIIHRGNTHHVYNDKSYLPTRAQDQSDNPSDHPFGWTMGIEAYCQQHNHHPDCTDPIRRSFIEREFVAHTINDPNSLAVLDEYLRVIHSNTIGHKLQWLRSSPHPVNDDVHERLELTRLYSEIDHQNGRAFHTRNGLRITIPEERWINWRTFSPPSQKEFTRVAWAQLTQFDKLALMHGLTEGKLDDRPIYLDFDNDAKHDKFWGTELNTVRQYYVELISRTGVFHYYNQYVMQDLAYNNEPLHLPLTYNWETQGRPAYLFLPYSHLMLKWDSKLNKWEYETHGEDSLSSCSFCSRSSHAASSCDIPSLAEPIDEFELEDGEVME